MSLSSWLRNGTGDEERRLLALQGAEDVDYLYAQWREDRLADYARVVPITAARRHRHAALARTQRRAHDLDKNAAPPVAPGDAA